MHGKSRLPRFARTACLGLAASVGLVLAAGAENLLIEEDAIVSLAGSPFVNDVSGQIDAAGRPSLSLSVTFISPCVKETGIDPTLYTPAFDAPSILLLRPNISDSGCPDIASPVDQEIRILLPSGVTEKGIYLISRPWRGDGGTLPDQPITFEDAATGQHEIVLEAAADAGLQLPQWDVVDIRAAAGGGYQISAKAALGDCPASDLMLSLFEIPDSQGTPVVDGVLATLPARCGSGDADTDLTLTVRAPARGFPRYVVVLNDAAPTARAIP